MACIKDIILQWLYDINVMNISYYKQKMCWHDLNCIWVGIVGLASISSSIYLFVRNWSITWMNKFVIWFCELLDETELLSVPLRTTLLHDVCVSSGVMLCVFRSSCSWNALQAHQADAFLFDGSTFQFQLCDCFFQLLLRLVVILLTTEWLQWLVSPREFRRVAKTGSRTDRLPLCLGLSSSNLE
jgi:hypothetical protein